MTPADYDAWYDTPRGRWVGETEFRLMRRLLAPRPGETLLDVGCGSGGFTRRFAAGNGGNITGLDIDASRLDYARTHGRNERYLEGDAVALPFQDAGIDCVVSIAALCFIADWPRAIREMVRVARRRVALGLLNRHSLLWREKGRAGGTGAYRGAYWHRPAEVRAMLSTLPLDNVQMRSALFLPGGSGLGRGIERLIPGALLRGGFSGRGGGQAAIAPASRPPSST
jgi:SAM-dependent methyltransferase